MANAVNRALETFNFWRQYRGEPEYDQQTWRASPHRTQAFMAADVQPIDQQPPQMLLRVPRVPTVPPISTPFNNLTPEQQQYLNRVFDSPNFLNEAAPWIWWVGRKMLGEGSFGKVGMWELQDFANAAANLGMTQMAVKESRLNLQRPQSADLTNEVLWMGACREQAASKHIVHKVKHEVAENWPNEYSVFNGMSYRIYMEYCELGSISTLLSRRVAEQNPLSELVFLGDSDRNHPDTPIAKVGDFGLVMDERFASTLTPRQAQVYRRQGTPTYYTPEQFTRRFDLVGWENDPQVGRYSYKMNIWGMGLIIWQLATLSRDPASAKRPFVPNFPIHGVRAAGVCYGIDIMAYPYSERLKQLILSCLYEDPRLRPEILDLKMRIRDGITSCMLQGMPIDPYTTFLPYEPPVNPNPWPPPPPGFVARGTNPLAQAAARNWIPVAQVNRVIPAAQVGRVATGMISTLALNMPPPGPPPGRVIEQKLVSLGRVKYVNTTCQFEYTQGQLWGQLCRNPCRATQAQIDSNEARCRTHPLSRFPKLSFQNTN